MERVYRLYRFRGDRDDITAMTCACLPALRAILYGVKQRLFVSQLVLLHQILNDAPISLAELGKKSRPLQLIVVLPQSREYV